MRGIRLALPIVLGFLIADGTVVAPRTAHGRADKPAARWTASKIKGTPEPPPPYVIEQVFPKIKFDRPSALMREPGSTRLWVAELGGKVVSFPNAPDASRADTAIDLAPIRKPFSAIYGMAFHPKFTENRYIYICYIYAGDKDDGSVVSRFTVGREDPPRIDPASERKILTFKAGGHNGGCLFFANDGTLFISTGDASGPTPPDQFDTGQDVRDLLSSILRIDVDREEKGKPYAIPADNPFRDMPGVRPEIWSYGYRNPWRMSVDRVTGDLWVGDVGWELWEMIYRVKKGGNYGWSVTEGPQSVHPNGRRGPTPILEPTTSHPHSEAASITGGYVYRGNRLPELQGLYIYGDYQSGTVWGLKMDGDKVVSRTVLAQTGLRLGSFGDDADGELYLIEVERTNAIYRLVKQTRKNSSEEFPKKLSQTGLFASTRDLKPAAGVHPYAINAPQWADGTVGERVMAVPPGDALKPNAEGYIIAIDGTVLAKTVSIDLVEGDPASRRRIETQVLHFEEGSWRPYTYVWNEDQTDATLLESGGLGKTYRVKDPRAPGGARALDYRVAARSECVLCHNPWVESKTTVFGRQSASPLGFTSGQLATDTPSGKQWERFVELGLLKTSTNDKSKRLTDPRNAALPVADRARSYLQVNCAHCHQFNAGGTATIQLSAALPMEKTETIDAKPKQGTFGIDDARIIVPGMPERSVLYYRLAKTGAGRMPRLGSQRVDEDAARLIASWIRELPSDSKSNPSPEAERAIAALESPSAEARGAAIKTLLGNTSNGLRLLSAIDGGKVGAKARDEIATAAESHSGVEIRDLFERFLPDERRVKRLGASWEPEVVLSRKGDAERGRRLFFGDSGTSCKTCHKVGDEGTSLVGPNLRGIGSKRSRADLLTQIREPSREIAAEYQTNVVALKNGEIVSGRVVESKPDVLTLLDAQGRTISIKMTDIEERGTQARSLMPEGALNEMTAEQAADLIEFLQSLR